MKYQARHPADAASQPVMRKAVIDGTVIGKPIDGSQYLEVVEEQEYAERRPTPEEQKPRFSYLKKNQLK
ncbi:MAG TPA: hypothetical protein VF427_12530 [Noviherbaspirillum sp.]